MAALADPGRSRAVLIGASAYRHLEDLPAVRNNLSGLRDVLVAPALGGLSPDHCTVVAEPARPVDVYRTLRQQAAAAEDTLLVYFSGHGRTGSRNELWLCLPDTDPGELPYSAWPYDELRRVVADSPAAKKVVILDCCFSGRALADQAGDEETILGQVGIEGTYLLTATAGNRVALAPPGERYTAFTGTLLGLLTTGIPDGPELLTFGQIYPRLQHTLTSRQLPRPRQQGSDTIAHLALTRNLAYTGRGRTRDFSERFTAIAAQLGDAQPAVRLVGVHAMAGLADDWEENRQTCIDVLCAYPRMRYEAEPGEDAPAAERHAFRAGREVRHTVIRVITEHLKEDAAVSWQGLNFDFSGVIFDGGDFSGAKFSGGTVSFSGAVFSSGTVRFSGAVFSGGQVDFNRAGFSGGKVSFIGAEFSGGQVDFNRAGFSGGKVSFIGAEFSGSKVSFSGAVFSGGQVRFDGAGFSDGTVSFGRAGFSGGLVSFNSAKFSGGRVSFSAEFSRGTVDFNSAAEFSGGTVDFRNARFSGGEVTFGVGAVFSGGTVRFDGAQFSDDGTVSLDHAKFSSGTVDFNSAKFSGGTLNFSGATFAGGTVSFDGTEFSGGEVDFNRAVFSGGKVSFYSSEFSGGEVDFGDAIFSGGEVDFRNPDNWSRAPMVDWADTDPPPAGVLLSDGQAGRSRHEPVSLHVVYHPPPAAFLLPDSAGDDKFAKIGWRASCPCGSGRKWRLCHGDPRNRADT